ncbi:MAG TPA: 7TM diverse intracellular signaling domain-containing protein [Chitinophagaceae bacterium]|nr:7TM diverse intracellular signaling domain-containing protein [Chitinophagaceae bacterium]
MASTRNIKIYQNILLLFSLAGSLFFSKNAASQDSLPANCIDISKIIMLQEIRSSIGMAYISKADRPEAVYASLSFRSGSIHNGTVPDNYVIKKALLKFTVCNTADTAAEIYFFPGFFYTDIRLFTVRGSSLIALPSIEANMKGGSGYRLIRLNEKESLTIVAELTFLKTYVNKIRPRLIHPQYMPAFAISLHNIGGESDLVTYIFCGLLLMMILYSLALFLQGANREFLYYSGYAFFLGSMLFTKAFFAYQTTPLNYFLEGYLDFVLQCLGIVFYMIFMQRFLNTRKRYKFLHKLYNAGIFLLSFAIIAFTFLHYGTDNYPLENMQENGIKVLLLVMVIIFLVHSLQRWKDKLLRYLFWGNLVYLLFALMSMALILVPHLFNLDGLAANSLIYYEAGLFFELVFFMAGLNYKNRRSLIKQTKERESLKAQNLLKEYEKEIAVYKAQQEERQRISTDMHDELGSGMTAIRLMSEIARNKMKENTPVEIEKISRSADDVLNKMNAIIWSMNSSNDTLDNLISYIRAWSLEYFENTPVVCKVKTPEQIPERELTGEKRRNIFLSVKETLNNVLKHAAASEVNIEIEVNDKLVICIADNGKGIDMDNLRQFGNGLKNITRRMEGIEGSFAIRNNNGTVTTLSLPF